MIKARISKLTLVNFRCFKKATFDLDADIVIITGKNGSGKSTVLYALTHILNGRSKNSVLNDIGGLENAENEGEDYKIKGVFKAGEKEWIVEIDGGNLSKDDDNKSLRKEKLSTFFQEHITSYDLKWLMSFIETFDGESNIRIPNLKNRSTKWIKTLKDKYLPSSVKEYEYRKRFLNEWMNSINMLSNKLKERYFRVFEKIKLDETNYKEIFDKFCIINNIKIENGKQKGFLNTIKEIKSFLKEIEKNEKIKVNNENKHSKDNILINFSKYLDRTIIVVPTVEDFEKFMKRDYIFEKNIFFFKKEVYGRFLKEKRFLENKIKTLESKYQNLLKLYFVFNLENFEGSFEDIISYLKKVKENIKHVDRNLLPKKVVEWIVSTSVYELEKEYKEWERRIDEEIELIKGHLSKLQRVLNALTDGLDFSKKYSLYFEYSYIETGKTVSDILGEKILNEKKENSFNDLFVLERLIGFLENQIIIEQELFEKLRKEKKLREKEKEILNVINAAKKVLNSESGKKSILNSIMTELSKKELEKIIKPVNSLLKLFHFPEKLLPLKIARDKKGRNYILKTVDNFELDYSQLSTGQKAILNIAFGIAANFLFEDELDHEVIMFDDITTSLDLSQLIPAAILFRKLAYTGKRQVILTTHHEDLTNKLLDYLIPPEGHSLKVIEFYDWPYDAGKSFNIYYLENKSKIAEKKDLEDIKYLIADDYLSFVQNND